MSRSVQQEQELQCGATVEGTIRLVVYRLTNLQASRNQMAQQVSQTPSVHTSHSAPSTLSHCALYLSVVEPDSAPSALSPCAVYRDC